ncbi:helix-turn-helix transcriptional regulator [Asticcacaulis sp. AC460]|uniref:helix-turn-helix transcriptional regulator n=1 Tax=Asticcacaulis sp. AC460 TaxID=1282360 RepID=UPI0004CF52BF|nr:helix-turn-helix transcriptional regulator [Asticcacaulis sp. AC460]
MRNSVRDLRMQRGWSQGELGERLGVSRQAVNAIEVGKHDPSLELTFKLAYLFNLPVEALFHPDFTPQDIRDDQGE